eukprot:1715741-Rhodomonas_salina.1
MGCVVLKSSLRIPRDAWYCKGVYHFCRTCCTERGHTNTTECVVLSGGYQYKGCTSTALTVRGEQGRMEDGEEASARDLSLIHISEPTRPRLI